MKKVKLITGIISVLVGIFLFLAAAFLFKCPPMESGAYMNCHKANVAVTVLSGIIVLSGLILTFTDKRVLSILFSAVAILAAVISAIAPGILINLCMMPEMTCRSVFRPVAVVCSVLILIAAFIRFFAAINHGTSKG
jgi:hypothetical protein